MMISQNGTILVFSDSTCRWIIPSLHWNWIYNARYKYLLLLLVGCFLLILLYHNITRIQFSYFHRSWFWFSRRRGRCCCRWSFRGFCWFAHKFSSNFGCDGKIGVLSVLLLQLFDSSVVLLWFTISSLASFLWLVPIVCVSKIEAMTYLCDLHIFFSLQQKYHPNHVEPHGLCFVILDTKRFIINLLSQEFMG